jgi:glyoxylase-like metal-dependent hydrolase (beta-lactamase superfamily II)
MVRLAERLNETNLPDSTQIKVQTFSRDTAYVLGRDTLHAFIVPGHSAGSTVYLFRGVLFAGDAVTHSPVGGFKSAKPQFSDDPREAAKNLALLWRRLPLSQIRVLCTAHAECVPLTPALVSKLGGVVR